MHNTALCGTFLLWLNSHEYFDGFWVYFKKHEHLKNINTKKESKIKMTLEKNTYS